jgi:acyl-CoA synthetase (NDP forming)
MKPDAVAVIGASTEEGKIGNSVMKNLMWRLQGRDLPDQSFGRQIMGRRRTKCQDVPGKIDVAVCHSGQVRRAGTDRSRRKFLARY